jgi:hypothetical protein
MSDTNKLINNVAFDIIALTTIWGLINYPNYVLTDSFTIRLNFNSYSLPITYSHSMCKIIIGSSLSFYLLNKYN